jgi:CheY-like chemotaxis protein
VLVVGEDPVAQGSLAELLVRAGYRMMQTTNRRDVLRIALHYRPDAILLNLTPGGTWTLDVLHTLQADAQACRIPIIVLSASASSLLTPEAKGTRVIFHNPFNSRRLLAQVAKLVGEAPVPGEARDGPGPDHNNVSLPGGPSAPVLASGERCRRAPGRPWPGAVAWWILADATRKRDLPWRFCSILQRLTARFLVKRRFGTRVDVKLALGLDG